MYFGWVLIWLAVSIDTMELIFHLSLSLIKVRNSREPLAGMESAPDVLKSWSKATQARSLEMLMMWLLCCKSVYCEGKSFIHWIIMGAKLSQDRKSTRLNSSHVRISYAV